MKPNLKWLFLLLTAFSTSCFQRPRVPELSAIDEIKISEDRTLGDKLSPPKVVRITDQSVMGKILSMVRDPAYEPKFYDTATKAGHGNIGLRFFSDGREVAYLSMIRHGDFRGPLLWYQGNHTVVKWISADDTNALIDLIRNEPNKAPEPTVRAVTPPAAQEPRQP